MLKDKQYDTAKYLLQIVIPALVVLIAGVGKLYGIDVDKLNGLLTLIATFGGTVLGVSSAIHAEKQKAEDGKD